MENQKRCRATSKNGAKRSDLSVFYANRPERDDVNPLIDGCARDRMDAW